MGVNIKDLVVKKPVTIRELAGKKFSVDGFNTLYQFLATIRQPDGNLLKDSKGRITSHLNGLFARTTNLMRQNLKLVFVFDGEVPKLKSRERERRRKLKEKAQSQYEAAKKDQDITLMKKFAQRTTRLTPEMVDQAKQLLDALGVPWVQAPSEGEAQAAYMAKKGDVYAAISQDYDTLLYETPILLLNLSVSSRKKMPGKLGYKTVPPQKIIHKELLEELGITNDQLIALAMLVGTDYNPKGIYRIGPKKALKLVQQHKEDFDTLFAEVDFNTHCECDWKEIFKLFKEMPVTDEYELKWKPPNHDKIKALLIDEFEFSKHRVESTLEKLNVYAKARQQKSLGDF